MSFLGWQFSSHAVLSTPLGSNLPSKTIDIGQQLTVPSPLGLPSIPSFGCMEGFYTTSGSDWPPWDGCGSPACISHRCTVPLLMSRWRDMACTANGRHLAALSRHLPTSPSCGRDGELGQKKSSMAGPRAHKKCLVVLRWHLVLWMFILWIFVLSA